MTNLDDLYTALEASRLLGKNDSYVRTIYAKTPEKLKPGTYRKIGRELIITKAGIDFLAQK